MDWNVRIRNAFAASPHSPDDDVIEELAQHARAMYEKERADGASDDEAERRVAAQIDRWRAEAPALQRRPRRTAAIEPPPVVSTSPFFGLGSDIRYALRLLGRELRYALLVVLTMALGIGATTVLFSVTYGVLVKPLPWPNGDRLVVVKETRGGSLPRFGELTNAAYLAWTEQAETIDGIAAWSQRLVTLSGAGDPQRIRVTTATASLFPVLGVQPLMGSFFERKDESSPVIVLSEGLWRERFSADPAMLGKAVQIDGRPYTVVGVVPDAAMYPDRSTRAVMPYSIRPAVNNYLSLFSALAVLRPGVTPAQAAAEGTARGRFVADTGMTTNAIFGNSGPVGISAQPLHESLTTDVRRPLIVLLVGVGLLLLTATANVASLQLARTTTRSREMAIRAALGAGGARVTRQLLIESLLLGGVGGAAGLSCAWLLHRSMPTLLPPDFPRVDTLGVDAAVATFAVVVSMVTGVAFGVLPAWRVRRLNLVETLAEGGTGAVGAARRSRTAQVRLFIMAGQVAIACVLLVGASLLVRSFVALLRTDRGFDPAAVITARVSMPATMYKPERSLAIANQILERLAALPRVRQVGFTSEIPLTTGGSTTGFTMPSRSGDGAMVSVQASPRVVSPHFFATIGMRLVEGRGFADSDHETAESVVVVNRAFARKYLGDAPLGVKLPVVGYWPAPEGVESTVIGVVDDVRYVGAPTTSLPELYFSHRQMRGRLTVPVLHLMVRADGDSAAVVPLVRSIVREADDRLVAEGVMPLEERLVRTLARPRLYAILLGGFAAFAIVIAGVGLFGVLSYSVAQRSREIAVRSALGATPAHIVRLVLRQGIAVTGGGIAAGLLGSALLGGSIAALLYGVTPHDRVTYIAVPVVLALVALVACVVPARRAARIDPLRVFKGAM